VDLSRYLPLAAETVDIRFRAYVTSSIAPPVTAPLGSISWFDAYVLESVGSSLSIDKSS